MHDIGAAVEDRTGRRAAALLGALVVASVLVVDPWGWYPFGPVRWLALSTLGFGGAAFALHARAARLPRPVTLAVVALLGWLAVAAAVGLDPAYAWVGTPERHFGWVTWALCAALLAAGSSLRSAALAPLRWSLASAALGLGGLSAAEAIGWEPDVFDAGSRLTSTLGSSAYLGAAVVLLLPIAAGVALDGGAGRARLMAGASLLPLGVAVVGSGARSAWTGLAVVILATLWARREVVRANARTAALGGALVALAVAAVLAATPAGERLASLTDRGEPGGSGRLDEWRVATRVVGDHLLTGVGPEGYRIAVRDGIDDEYEREHGRDVQPDRAHSAPLDVALAGGLPALLAWVAVWVAIARAAWAQLRAGPPWLAGVAAALIAHLVGQLTLFPLAELEPIAWLLGGVLLGAGAGGPHRRASSAQRIAVPVLSLAALVAAVAGIADVAADRRAAAAVDAAQRGDTTAAAEAALDAVDVRPDVIRLRLLAARLAIADERGILAGIRQIEAALDVSPGDPIVLRAHAELLVDRAEATAVPAHLQQAATEVERLLDDDPNSAALWQLAERVAELHGDQAAAREAHARWLALTPPERRDG